MDKHTDMYTYIHTHKYTEALSLAECIVLTLAEQMQHASLPAKVTEFVITPERVLRTAAVTNCRLVAHTAPRYAVTMS